MRWKPTQAMFQYLNFWTLPKPSCKVSKYLILSELFDNLNTGEESWVKYLKIWTQEKIADPNLIAKWKKQGYENLCCLRCIQVILLDNFLWMIFWIIVDNCIEITLADNCQEPNFSLQTRDTNFATNCICRVPKNKLEEGRIVECVHCGCRGCSG